jgi:hypothetical protein
MSMSTTVIDAPATKVIRLYAITPDVPESVNGRKQPAASAFTIGLRYSELEAARLHRDSAEAAAEALKLARRRRDLPEGTDANVVCIRETLRRDDRPPAA